MNAGPMNKRVVGKPLASLFLVAISAGVLGIPTVADAKAKHPEKPLVSKKVLKAKAQPAAKKVAHKGKETTKEKGTDHKLSKKDPKHKKNLKTVKLDKKHPAKHPQASKQQASKPKPKVVMTARHQGRKYAQIASADAQQEYLIPGAPPAYLTPDTQAAEDTDTDSGPRPTGRAQVGAASYYSDSFDGGRTASGERFNQDKLTCAHGSLPFGCKLRVTNLRNHRSVDVKVNDRGGFSKYGRVVDLSKAAAREIGMLGTGTAKVKVEVLQ